MGNSSFSISSPIDPAMVKISSATASASATIDFTGLDGAYSSYVIEMDAVIPATNAVEFYIRTGTGGTPTYQSGASDYNYSAVEYNTGGVTGNASNGAAFMRCNARTFGTVAGEEMSGKVNLFNPSNASANKRITGQIAYRDSLAAFTQTVFGGTYRSNTPVTAIRFLFSSGNIASGVFTLYGIK